MMKKQTLLFNSCPSQMFILYTAFIAKCFVGLVSSLFFPLRIGNFKEDELEWKKLLVLSCTVLEKVSVIISEQSTSFTFNALTFQSLPEAMRVACEIISPDPPGGAARIDLQLFRQLYSFLVLVDGEVPQMQVEAAMTFLTEES